MRTLKLVMMSTLNGKVYSKRQLTWWQKFELSLYGFIVPT